MVYQQHLARPREMPVADHADIVAAGEASNAGAKASTRGIAGMIAVRRQGSLDVPDLFSTHAVCHRYKHPATVRRYNRGHGIDARIRLSRCSYSSDYFLNSLNVPIVCRHNFISILDRIIIAIPVIFSR
jgi:hypothetical protein